MNVLTQRFTSPALMIALFAFVLQATAWAQSAAEREQNNADNAKLALIKNIPVPDNPDAIAGTFELGGETVKVTAGEHYDVRVLINQMEGSARRPLSSDDAWARIILNAWADALEIQVTPDEIEKRLQTRNPAVHEGLLKRWNAIGVSAESGEAYERSRLKIAHLKNLLFDSNRATTRAAFDQFKTRKLQYQFEYVCFQNSDFTEELKAKGVTDEDLQAFWKRDRSVAARFRLPATVSGGIVYFDPSEFTPEMVAQLGDASKVTRKRALAYFKANQKRLVGAIPPNKRHLLSLGPDTPLEKVVSPFSLVKDEIMKKLTLEHLITEAHQEALASGAKADLPALAKKYHLGYHKLDKLDRRGAMQELREFGIPAFSQLYGAPVGHLSRQLSVVGDLRFFFFVSGREESRLPELADVKDEIRAFYLESQAGQLARAAAKEILDEMDAKVNKLLEPERVRLAQEATDQANDEIAQMNLTKESDKRRARARAQGRMRLPLDKKRKSLLPDIFDEIVKRRKLQLTKTPYFEFAVSREDRSTIKDVAASRLMFLTASYQVRALPKGGVTAMILEDHLTHSYILGRLLDKKDPSINTMGPVDLIQARGQVKQIAQARFPRNFRFADLRKQFGFKATK